MRKRAWVGWGPLLTAWFPGSLYGGVRAHIFLWDHGVLATPNGLRIAVILWILAYLSVGLFLATKTFVCFCDR
jgi:hypothetical protein